MYSGRMLRRVLRPVLSLLTLGLLFACGGGGDGSGSPSITILQPTSEPVYATTWTDVRLGGSIAGAAFVHVTNTATGYTTEGYVFYNQGLGSWFADIPGLTFGDNPITVVADEDGRGINTARDAITVTRPQVPLNLIFNGVDSLSASSHWIDLHSLFESHKIALYEDGTGRSTTGSLFTEDAGPVVDITWSKLGPDEIVIVGCPNCSHQRLSRIAGSLEEEMFFAQVESVGGSGETALHVFVLAPARL